MRRPENFDAAGVAAMLPTVPPPGFLETVEEKCGDDLGGLLCVYRRASSAEFEEAGELFFEEKKKPRKWAARCTCTACGYTWGSGWHSFERHSTIPAAVEAILDESGTAGEIFPGVPEDGDVTRVFLRGETLPCPWCGKEIALEPAADLRAGRLHQVLAVEQTRAGDYTAVMYWMAVRRFSVEYSAASAKTFIAPHAAAVVDRAGAVRLFHWKAGRWKVAPCALDPEDLKYYSAEAVSNRKAGVFVPQGFGIPPQSGDTGEKTGLWEYLHGGGTLPAKYLRFWEKNRNVENIIKAGWTHAVETALAREWDRVLHATAAPSGGAKPGRVPDDEISVIADYSAARPCDMLHLTRQEVRQGAAWKWDAETLMLWMAVTSWDEGPPPLFPGEAEFFMRMIKTYGLDNLREWGDCGGRAAAYFSLLDVDRYLRRQVRVCDLTPVEAMKMLWDYAGMLAALPEYPEGVTAEEIWPNHLRTAHDALAERTDKKEAIDFAPATRAWAGLEWTDGKFCVRLPRSMEELVEEGRTLHHCVASYGRAHASGKLILFVRRYRRPERSFFTLNEDCTGTQPVRVQLHGYRNDFIKGRKRAIPADVEAFVERWEREVLRPVFREKAMHGEVAQFKRRNFSRRAV